MQCWEATLPFVRAAYSSSSKRGRSTLLCLHCRSSRELGSACCTSGVAFRSLVSCPSMFLNTSICRSSSGWWRRDHDQFGAFRSHSFIALLQQRWPPFLATSSTSLRGHEKPSRGKAMCCQRGCVFMILCSAIRALAFQSVRPTIRVSNRM